MKRFITLLLALVLVATFAPVVSIEAEALMKEEGTLFDITYAPGGASGRSQTSGYYSIGESVTLPSASAMGFSKEGYEFAGWSISGRTYGAGDSFTGKASGSLGSDGQYHYTATAKWDKEGSSSSSSGSSSGSSSSSSSKAERIRVTYKPGDAPGSAQYYYYEAGTAFQLIDCPFTYEGYSFQGWADGSGSVYAAGTSVKTDKNETLTATWKKKGIVIGGSSESSSSETSSSSSSTSSSSSSVSSSKPASSKPSSSSKPVSSSSSFSSSSSSVPESSLSSSSVVEVPEVYVPQKLAFSISGDIPVTQVEIVINEDIGGKPALSVTPIDKYSVTDNAAAAFVANGDAISAFDLSVTSDGLAYNGPMVATVNYHLNGTQANKESNYDQYVLAMVHTVSLADYYGEYYILEDGKTYLYNAENDFKTEITNVILVEEDGVNRPVIADPASSANFAYKADENVIVEVQLVSSVNASVASIDVTSLSPILLVQLEVGDGSSSGAGIPFWVWIIIGVLVILIGGAVALFIIGRNSTQKSGALRERQQAASKSVSSGITGFDDDEF